MVSLPKLTVEEIHYSIEKSDLNLMMKDIIYY